MTKTRNTADYDPIRLVGKVVNFVAFGLLVIFSLWVADDLYEVYTESVRQETLLAESAVQQDLLDEYRRVAEEISGPIAAFQERTIKEKNLAAVQDLLVGLAKETKCNLKKSTPKGHYVRPLGVNALEDDPSSLLEKSIEDAEFLLHQETLSLSLEGKLGDLLTFCDNIEKQNWLCSIDEATIYRRVGENDRLTMEFEIVFHEVVPGKTPEEVKL